MANKYVAPRGPDGKWLEGHSGNPFARAGTRNRISTRILKDIEGDVGDVLKTLVTAAKGGDIRACTFIVGLMVPKARLQAAEAGELPAADLSTARGVAEAHSGVIHAASQGKIDPDVAASLSSLLNEHRKILELVTLEDKIAKLENSKAIDLADFEPIKNKSHDVSE